MKITIELDSNDLTAESTPQLIAFLSAVPIQAPKPARKTRTIKPRVEAPAQPLQDVPIVVGEPTTAEGPNNGSGAPVAAPVAAPINPPAAEIIQTTVAPPAAITPPATITPPAAVTPPAAHTPPDTVTPPATIIPLVAVVTSSATTLIDWQNLARTALRAMAALPQHGRPAAEAAMHKYAKQANDLTEANCKDLLADIGAVV